MRHGRSPLLRVRRVGVGAQRRVVLATCSLVSVGCSASGLIVWLLTTAARQLNLRGRMAQPPLSRRPGRLKGQDGRVKPEPRSSGPALPG